MNTLSYYILITVGLAAAVCLYLMRQIEETKKQLERMRLIEEEMRFFLEIGNQIFIESIRAWKDSNINDFHRLSEQHKQILLQVQKLREEYDNACKA